MWFWITGAINRKVFWLFKKKSFTFLVSTILDQKKTRTTSSQSWKITGKAAPPSECTVSDRLRPQADPATPNDSFRRAPWSTGGLSAPSRRERAPSKTGLLVSVARPHPQKRRRVRFVNLIEQQDSFT